MAYQSGAFHLKEIEQMGHKKTTYLFLNQYFSGLKTDEDQTLWLYEAIRSSNLSKTETNSIINAVRYVILSHDIHENIDEKKAPDPLQNERREMTVLAGDFYSALYYRILAEAGVISLLASLQRGIQKTNIAKANIYELGQKTESEYLADLTASYTAIFSEFATYFGQSKHFIQLAEKAILLSRLQKEGSSFQQLGESSLERTYNNAPFIPKNRLSFENWLGEIINKIKKDVKASFQAVDLSEGALFDRINGLIKS